MNQGQKINSSSNSLLKDQILTLSHNRAISLKIDMITITARISSSAELPWSNNITINPYVEIYNISTSMLEGQAYNKALYFKYDKFQATPSQNNIRIDFNPSKIAEHEDFKRTFLDYLDNINMTRLDIAFDVPMDLMNYRFTIDRVQKGAIYHDSDMKPQTRYWGTRNSARYTRLYNKQLEQLEKHDITIDHPLTRLEFQLKNNWINNWENCLNGVRLIKPSYQHLEGLERAIAIGLLHDSKAWEGLSVNTRKKYRTLINKLPVQHDMIPALQQALSDNTENIKTEIARWTTLTDTLNFNKQTQYTDEQLEQIAIDVNNIVSA